MRSTDPKDWRSSLANGQAALLLVDLPLFRTVSMAHHERAPICRLALESRIPHGLHHPLSPLSIRSAGDDRRVPVALIPSRLSERSHEHQGLYEDYSGSHGRQISLLQLMPWLRERRKTCRLPRGRSCSTLSGCLACAQAVMASRYVTPHLSSSDGRPASKSRWIHRL